MNTDDLFLQATKDNTIDDDKTYADRIVEKAEGELKAATDEQKLRNAEKAELSVKLRELQIRLHKHRNVRNPKMVAANTKAAATREKIRNEIALVKDRLQVIAYEEQGASIGASQVVEKSRNA